MEYNSWERVIPIIVLFVCAEQLFMNYHVVNERGEISGYSLEHGYYNDGTVEVVDELKKIDTSLYRVNKTYSSVFLNDSYMQGYNGVSLYSSTNSAILNKFVKNLDIQNMNNHPNYVSVDSEDMWVNELLGVKYLITERGEAIPDGYVEILQRDKLVLYEDYNSLPFGYLYTDQLSVNQYNRFEGTEAKSEALMCGFYAEEEIDGFAVKELSESDLQIGAEEGREQLKRSKIYDITFEENTYSAKVVNDGKEKAMLCVPLIYENRWLVSLNGEEAKYYNINGGLIGVEIPTGTYTVKILYDSADYEIAQVISAISWIVYVLVLMYYQRYKVFFA